MRHANRISVIIPALNEEAAIGKVVAGVPPWVDEVIVVDNGSSDRTMETARSAGARVLSEPRRGYGSACLTGIAAAADPDVIVFLDGDFSDSPEEMGRLVDPIIAGEADLVIGSRVLGRREPGSLTPQARFGNWLSCQFMRWFWGVRYTDLGPFRAVSREALQALQMMDPNYGWTVEMQIKAARRGRRSQEAPVSYRRRIGQSKVSGTAKGVILAGSKILYFIFKEALASWIERPGKKHKERLLVFTRYPEPGKTKTRLIPQIGAEKAAELQKKMTERTLDRARRLRWFFPLAIEVLFEGGDAALIANWLGRDLSYFPQSRGDIGERMRRALARAFEEGSEKVVLVGSDIPGLTSSIMQAAFKELEDHDLVLGPARDGGYYLIGMRRSARAALPRLFEGVPWSTAAVLEETLARIRGEELTHATVATLSDVDRPEDLPKEHQDRGADAGRAPMISIIIPVLNEAAHIARALQSGKRGENVELIVVDGGGSDGSAELARAAGAKVVSSPPGRAVQMNAGASVAAGEFFIFLHADTMLPPGFDWMVRGSLSVPGTAAGAFALRLDRGGGFFSLIEAMANLRAKWRQMPYGDQAIFVSRRVFSAVGGFPEQPIMEDFELVRRLRKKGRIAVLPAPAITSARRWTSKGPLKTTILHQLIIMAYLAGADPERIARWRDATRKETGR